MQSDPFYITIAEVDARTPHAQLRSFRLQVRDGVSGQVVRNIDISAVHNSIEMWSPPGVSEDEALPPASAQLVGSAPQGRVNLRNPSPAGVTPYDASVSCPGCGKSDFDGDSPDFEGASCTQRCGCRACDCEWVVDYMALLFTVIT